MANKFLIYGANGYTGELITRFAAERGLRPIIAGRNAEEIAGLANKHGLEHSIFGLDETDKLDKALQAVDLVIHCAGPFSLTSQPMVDACLRNKKHYLDITGEISVFESMAALDNEAKAAGIVLMPGVGFDVVPSDCLAVYLKEKLPSATDLTLAFYTRGGVSHGTLSTMMMNIGKGGAIRKNGKITSVPAAWKTQKIDFGEFTKDCVTIPWGDVATAYYSTGIPNIKVFTATSPGNIRIMKLSRYIGSLLALKPVQKILQGRIPSGGPSDKQREKGRAFLWGKAVDDDGNAFSARLETPEAYKLTAITAINIAERIVNGVAESGYQTPAKLFGHKLITDIFEIGFIDIK